MFKKHTVVSIMAIAVMALSLFLSACKKEDKTPTHPQQAPSPTTLASVAEYGFDDGVGGWNPTAKTIKLESTSTQKHGGNAGLKISGTAGNGLWNFAASPKFNLEPGKKYKLTGWLLIESWDKNKFPPLLKCAVYQDSKWVANAFSKKYDLTKSKEWQEVSAVFEAPQGANINGYIAFEKGTQDPITANIYLDDIKIEPVQ